jgi:D-alanine--poly(phosphoribitol) ligase subunit 2
MQDTITTLILDTMHQLRNDLELPDMPLTADTPLFGQEGVLDSLGLVTLVVAVEQAIEDQYRILVSLADEKALSQKNSPFRTVSTLADYAVQQLQPQL